ncbi:unnamed protein product [Diabrotica balteata]|uniref:Uncharacterized protein n=1 Tax=Diabrotica balteata TaxID=107213 RepID=A0A9N9X8D2_DIABA|nr:unnamed protein product [Diabrotica balteata]
MAKRKAASDSENEQKPAKRSKSSIREDLNMVVKSPTIKKEIQLEDETTIRPEATPKAKKNRKNQGEEKQSMIDSILNETKRLVLSTKKPKKSKKSQKQDDTQELNESLTIENIKTEALDSFENSNMYNVQDENEEFDGHPSNEEPLNNVTNGEKVPNSPRINTSYQDEDDSMMEKIEKKVNILQNIQVSPSKTKSPQELLKDLYPNLKLSPIKTKLKLKSNSDVYMLRVPKSVDADALLNMNINFEEKSKVTIGGDKFVIRTLSKIPDPTFALSTKTHMIDFKANLVMEKYIKPNKGPNVPTIEKTAVQLPNTLKNRHPLFGSNFEEKIQLDEAVEKKLTDAINNLLKSKKNKKAKEDRKSLINSTMLPNVTSTQFCPNVSYISPKKKIKKEKQQLETNNSDIFNNISIADVNPDDFIPPIRKTKIKKEKPDPVFDISNDLEENSDSPKKAKKRKIKEEPVDFSPPKKKKKKKVKEEYE